MRLLPVLRHAGIAWTVALACAAGPALAAPFCIQSQALPPQCNYFDAAQCQQDAQRQGGVCSANPRQTLLQPGNGQFCLVTASGSSSCIYPDRGSCMADAARQRGACTEAPALAPARAPDPFAAVGGL